MGKHHTAELMRKIAPEPQADDDFDEDGWNEPQFQRPTLGELEARYSDWKHNKDDDLATAVRRYALPMRRVRIWDEVEVGR
jgi:hypothetical protein